MDVQQEKKRKAPPPPCETGNAAALSEEQQGKRNLIHDITVIAIILLFALVMRSYRLGYPPKMYFDEIYYAKGAMNYLNGQEDTNWVHPPLGKIFIAVGMVLHNALMSIFSKLGLVHMIETAADWRFASLIAGCAMIPLIYFFALRLFKERYMATISCFLLSIEFLHFAESRIAMLDIFLSALMLGGFYCTWCYIEAEERFDRYLYGAAIIFGIAMACKWNGLFGVAGAWLSMIFLKDTGPEILMKSRYLDSQPERNTFPRRFFITILAKFPRAMRLAAVFFLAGAIIQLLSYIPFFTTGGTFKKLIDNHARTLHFHYKEKWEHPYLSQMWQWPTMIRPIWYYFEEQAEQVYGIIAMGSPLFWWGFLIFLIELLVLTIFERRRLQIFLLIGYFFPYIFWLISNKGGFFYYMTPCVAWMCLISAYGLGHWRESSSGKIMGWIYLAALLLFFFMFYPIMTGYAIPRPFFNKLMWLQSWI